MAMQLPKSRRKQSSKVTPLRVVEHPNAFGAHLIHVRNRASLPQQEVADALPEYFVEYNVTFPTSNPRDMYRKTEKGIRAAQFEELIPLYATLIGCGIRQSAEERHTFVRLARLKLETLQRKRPPIRPESDWVLLEAQLAKIDQQEQERSAQTVLDAALSESVFDISHVVGRDDWLRTALAYLHTTPPKKLVVIQGMMGVGKTTCLKLLLQSFSEQDGYQPILHLFSDQQDMTSEDHFDNFLATILARREVLLPESKVPDRREQVKLLLDDLRSAEQRVILLLDDAQVILDEHSQLPAVWQDFFTEFLQRPHQAVIYLATREWSMWPGRDPIYIVDGDRALLPRLGGEAGLEIWRRFGFGDVDTELLKRATERFGGNPRMIELRATTPQRREIPFSWEWSETQPLALQDVKSEHQELIEQLLEDPQIFGDADVEVQQLLECVVSQHVSSDALPILEALAVSPLALPFPLLVSVTPQAKFALVELLNTSLLDQTAIANKRAGVQPLTREAVLHTFLKEGQRGAVERQISQLYEIWMDQGTFRDEQEQAQLITELTILYLKHRRLLQAAELFAQFGWLCAMFGLVARIQRTYEEVIKQDRRKDRGDAYEAGRILFFYSLQLIVGKSIDVRARDRDFHVVRDLALTGKIALQPRTEISIAHYLMQKMLFEKRYQEAYDFLQGTFDRLSANGDVKPEVETSFLHSQSTLLGRWSTYTAEMNQLQEVARLHQECVAALTEGIRLWRMCLFKALPVQEYYLKRKIGDGLQDLAYYLRMLGRIDDAEQAILECLKLKEEEKAGLPGDLAVAIGEYAKILAAQGRYKEAVEKSADAIKRIEEVVVKSGNSFAKSNLGMLLIERAQIYEMQGRLDGAYELAEQGIPLLKPNRRLYKMEAEELCARIQAIRESPVRYHLDSQWFPDYHLLAQYNDVGTLAQAGPFSPEEARLWSELFPNYREPAVWEQLAQLVRQSRSREFERSLKEKRLPILLYPAIDLEDVNKRMQGFSALQSRIEHEEKNSVVRRLYMRKIEEHLLHLRLIAATHAHDIETVRVCNEALYGRISQAEMAIALQKLFVMLKRAEGHPQASEMAKTVLKQLEQWRLVAADFLHDEETREEGDSAKLKLWNETPVSAHTVQQFFKQVMSEYGFTEWSIIPSPDKNAFELDLERCVLYIPTEKEFSVLTVAELLAEEIETHMFRSVSGQRSKLALLGTGTRGYLVCEEGLAKFMVQEMWTAQGLGQKLNTWITTLALGLVQGTLVPSHSYETLQELLYRVMLTGQLEKGNIEGAERVARGIAFRRTTRTFIGVPEFLAVGVCDMRDRAYLQGYREVSKLLTRYPLERLLVGSISTDDLDDLEEMHILSSSLKHRRLACQPDLFERIMGLEK